MFHHVTGDELAAIQPGISPRFIRATFTPCWYSISDPRLYTLALAQRFTAEGGVLERADVSALRPTESGIEIIADTARRADHVVVA
ncbi:FAD-dependent oxidoreductase, partial [Escherichia coli]